MNWSKLKFVPKSSLWQNTHTCTHMHTHDHTEQCSSPLGGAQKFPARKAGHRNSGNNWVSVRSLGPSQSHFPILDLCVVSGCCVGSFTGHRNNPPSGSPSSFVDKEVSWHHYVPGWWCFWYTKEDGIDLFIHSWVLVTVKRPWALWGLFCIAGILLYNHFRKWLNDVHTYITPPVFLYLKWFERREE